MRKPRPEELNNFPQTVGRGVSHAGMWTYRVLWTTRTGYCLSETRNASKLTDQETNRDWQSCKEVEKTQTVTAKRRVGMRWDASWGNASIGRTLTWRRQEAPGERGGTTFVHRDQHVSRPGCARVWCVRAEARGPVGLACGKREQDWRERHGPDGERLGPRQEIPIPLQVGRHVAAAL